MRYMPRSYDLFDDLFDDFIGRGYEPVSSMKTDIVEKGDAYLLNVELPGFNKEDVHLDLKDGYLVINATRKEEHNEEEDKYLRKERYTGTVSRSFYVGDNYKIEDIKARFDNGELIIQLPKTVEQKQIENTNIQIE